MNCNTFQRWLDDGCPEASAQSANTHAETCVECAAALAAWREVDALLAEPVGRAPSGFADRVMAKVGEADAAEAAARRSQPRRTGLFRPAMAWWVDAAAQPASVLAMTLASLLVWQREALWGFANDLASGKFPLPQMTWIEPLQRADVGLGVALGMLPVAALAGYAAYRLAERLVRGGWRTRGVPLGAAG